MQFDNATFKQNAIYTLSIVKPLEDTISKLEKGEYRNCDIDILNDKLDRFIKTALTVINREFVIKKRAKMNTGINKYDTLNDYNTDLYLSYFKTLLGFFERLG